MRRDVFVEGHRGRVSSKAFCESLRDRSGCSNLFCFGEQPCSPDSVTFVEGFVIIVERCFELLFEGGFGFEFVFGVFDEGRERASATRIYLLCLPLLRVSLHFLFVLTSDTATWQTSGHLDGAGTKVDLRVMLLKPAESEDHALLPQLSHSKEDSL